MAEERLPVLRDSRGPAQRVPLLCKPARPEPELLHLPCVLRKVIFFCLDHPGPRHQAMRDHLYSPDPPKFLRLPTPTCLPCVAVPLEPQEDLCLPPPNPAPRPPGSRSCLSMWPCMPGLLSPVPGSTTNSASLASPASPLVTAPDWPSHKRVQNSKQIIHIFKIH